MYNNQLIFWNFLFFTQILHISGTGQFFIGLLNYTRVDDGMCCSVSDTEASCSDACQLLFDIEVHGLNGSTSVLSRRLSEEPISLAVAETFQGVEATNPLSFNFIKWPGEVNITIKVFDQDNGTFPELVDQFHASLAYQGQGYYYFLRSLTGNQSRNTSLLTIVYRYGCNPTNGRSCFTDCVDHEHTEMCPLTSPLPRVTDVTFTGFTNRKCEQKDSDGNVISSNCTTDFTSPAIPTTAKSPVFKTPSKPSKSKTPPIKYQDSGTTPASRITANVTNSTASFPSSTNGTSEPKSVPITQKPASITQAVQTKRTTLDIITKSDISASNTASTGLPKAVPTNIDDTMEYWPAIVGGVLGGLFLLGGVGFLIYYKRQKKLRKRQEIYNVNPKILRNFEEYEENATSGRADVPLETEQY